MIQAARPDGTIEMKKEPSQKIQGLERIDYSLVNDRRWVWLLFTFALLLKLIFVFQSRDSLQVTVPILDARYYVDMARDIAGGNWARREAFFMGPLYPYLMALVFSVFGKGFTAMRLIQASGGAFTVVLSYLIGTRVFRPSVAMLGAVLLALYGTITFFEGQLLMTWLGTLLNLLLLFVLLGGPRKARFLSLLDRHHTVRPAAAGVLLGLSALARASILVIFPVILAWIFFVDRDGRRLVRAAVFTAGALAAILPVTLHNRAASGDTVLITSNGGMNFYIGNNASATGV